MGGVTVSSGDGKKAFQVERVGGVCVQKLWTDYVVQMRLKQVDYGRPQLHEKLLDHRELPEVSSRALT